MTRYRLPLETLQLLVRLGFEDLDEYDGVIGFTPLLNAVRYKRRDMVEALVGLGSKALETPSVSGLTPLSCAIVSGHKEIARILRALGANVVQELDQVIITHYHNILAVPLEEGFVREVRYRVHFAISLTGLLCSFLK